jgi:putative thioredoxin
VAETKSAWVFDVTEQDFERAVIEASREVPIVVDFWAPWCGPCRTLGPTLERLVNERGGQVRLAKVNVDEAQQLAGDFGIEGIPAVKALRDGRVVLEFVGLLQEPQLREFLDRICPSEADGIARKAREQEEGNPAQAEQLYRQALEMDREQQAALLGLARLRLAQGQEAEVGDLLDRVTSGGDQAAEVSQLRGILSLRELARQFGDEAAARRRLAKAPDNAEAHYELGCVLAAAGRYPEALEACLTAAEKDRKLAAAKVKDVMVQVFHIVGVRSPLAEEYRDKLTRVLY